MQKQYLFIDIITYLYYSHFLKDPLGWGVQFDYPYFNSPDNLPFYTTTCKSNDGCSGQGFCDLKNL